MRTKIDSVFPDSLEQIKCSAFFQSKVCHVDLGKGLKRIDSSGCSSGVFEECKQLRHVEIPPQVEKIGHRAFCRSGLESVVLHDGLRRIENSAFGGCLNLKKVEIPSTVEYLSDGNFEYAEKITLKGHPENFFKNRKTQAALITEVNLSDKNGDTVRFYLPEKTPSAHILKLDEMLSKGQVSKIQNMQMNICRNIALKQEIAIRMHDDNPDNQSNNAYLRRAALSIAKRYLQENCTEKLVKLLSYDFLTVSSLKKLLALSENAGNPTILTYILDTINKKSGKKNANASFRL